MRLCRVQSGCQGEIEERDGKASEDDPVYYGAARVHFCIMGNNICHIEYQEKTKKKIQQKLLREMFGGLQTVGYLVTFPNKKIKILQRHSVSLIAKTCLCCRI